MGPGSILKNAIPWISRGENIIIAREERLKISTVQSIANNIFTRRLVTGFYEII